MSKCQPVGQLLRRLIWRVAIEWHKCRRATLHATEFGAPGRPIDSRHLDLIFASVDDFFEALNDHGDEKELLLGQESETPILFVHRSWSSGRNVERVVPGRNWIALRGNSKN